MDVWESQNEASTRRVPSDHGRLLHSISPRCLSQFEMMVFPFCKNENESEMWSATVSSTIRLISPPD